MQKLREYLKPYSAKAAAARHLGIAFNSLKKYLSGEWTPSAALREKMENIILQGVKFDRQKKKSVRVQKAN